MLSARRWSAGWAARSSDRLGGTRREARSGGPLSAGEGARRAVLYLAVFPMTLFLQAMYSESLYLLLAIAAFVLAKRGRFQHQG